MVFKQDHSTWMPLVFVSLKHSRPQLPALLSHSKAPAWHGLKLLAQLEWRLSLPLGPGFCHLWLSLRRCKKLLWDGLKSEWPCPGPAQQGCKCIILASLLFLAFTNVHLTFISPNHLLPVHPDLFSWLISASQTHPGSLFWPLWGLSGFPGVASGKEPTCQCRRHESQGFDLWVGKIPWRGKWQPTPAF